MNRLISMLTAILLLIPLYGCSAEEPAQIAATTLAVYDFTSALCENTGLRVKKLITEEVSCLHDYTLQVDQTKLLESAELVVISGAGLEDFLPEISDSKLVDASNGIPLHAMQPGTEHSHDHHEFDEHIHAEDPHIWLSIQNAKAMCSNILNGLLKKYPQFQDTFSKNHTNLISKLDDLESYAARSLSGLSHTELITFHDGFHYLAESFDLTVVRSIEEEYGSEASASDLKELIMTVREHALAAIFIEKSGSVSAAGIVSNETGVPIYTLDMAISGESYFDAMYHNIDVLKEALG